MAAGRQRRRRRVGDRGIRPLAPRRADTIDAACLGALLVFLIGAVASSYPRQSLDSALGALTWTATFFLARLLLARPDARAAVVRVLIGLSVVLTLVAAARWLPTTVEWWTITGVTPPLDMNHSGVLWGHRHDLALVVAVLYPAWWIGQRSPMRTAAAIVFGILAALVVLVDGSRTMWLAIVIAGLTGAAPAAVHAWHPSRQELAIGGAAVALGVAVGVLSGVISAAADRLLTTNTLVSRADMWGALLEVWARQPIAGAGPGSFAWLLQGTDYFDANSWAPRHPDSLPFQLLPEVGVLGVIAVAIVVVALAPAVWRGGWAPRFALVALAAAGIGANPTEFGFLMLVAVAWAGLAAPNAQAETQAPRRWTRAASFAMLGIIGVAFASTAVAAFFHDGALRSIAETDIAAATSQLETAGALDPGLALYPRLLGAVKFIEGDHGAAETALSRATELNPNDDLAWRSLALVRSEAGDIDGADEAIGRAVELHRADPTNLLIRLTFERLRSDDEALPTAGEVVHAWPWIIGLEGWAPFVGLPTTDALDAATERATEGATAPQQSNSLHVVWLAALAGDEELLAGAIETTGLTRTLGEGYAAAVVCDPSVPAYLEGAPDADRRFDEYWALRVRQGGVAFSPDEDAERAWEIMTGLSLDEALEPLNPLDENGFQGLSTDTWGYRRPPATWPDLVDLLPSPDAAYRRWMVDPIGSALTARARGAGGLPMNRAGLWRITRDALTVAGLVYIALVWLRIAPYAPPVPEYGPMFDAYGFWNAWQGGLYDIPWGEYEAYVYSPAFAQLLWPFTLLPWPVFAALWTGAAIGCLFWMRVPWMIAFPGVIDDILRGNIHVFLAASIVLAIRFGAPWAFGILTKVTPGIGLPLARRAARVAPPRDGPPRHRRASSASRSRSRPELWFEWFGLLAENTDTTARIQVIPLPLLVRLPIAAVLIAFAARTDRAWLLPIGVMIALPNVWTSSTALLAGSASLWGWSTDRAQVPDRAMA